MKARLCNKCKKVIDYPFYSITFKGQPKILKKKLSFTGSYYSQTEYPSKHKADICKKCWNLLGIKTNEESVDFKVPLEMPETKLSKK